MEETSRRDFLRVCFAAGATGLLLWSGVGCSKNGNGNPTIPHGQSFTMNLANYPQLSGNNTAVSVNGTPLGRPLIVTHVTGDQYHALDSSCTHQQCTVAASMHCPCHGSVYSLTGQNISGPAPRPLTSFEVTKDGTTLTINF